MNLVPAPPASPGSQFWHFVRLRGRLLRNTVQVLREQATVRLASIAVSSLLIWAFLFFVSYNGFAWIRDTQKVPPFGAIYGVLFDMLFVALAWMLVFSSGLILYSALFASAESTFLLSTPARADQIFAYKYQGALGFSSWGFLLLGSPALLAFGLVYRAHWLYFVLLPLYFLGFVLLPGCLGGLAGLLIANAFPRKGKQVVVLILLGWLVLTGLGLYVLATSVRPGKDGMDAANQFLDRLGTGSISLYPPSRWMTQGLQAAGEGHLFRTPLGEPGALYYLGLVWSFGLAFYLATAWLAGRFYRRGYNRLRTGGMLRRRYGGHALDRFLDRLLRPLDPQTRLLIVKDFRTFRRDPTQWAQILIFAGLIVLYFTNMRRFFLSGIIDWTYQNFIGLLNTTTIGLLLCIYTGRFIFPMLSLEGRKFWVLGLLPLKRERLLWGKFAFSAVGALLMAEGLVLLSDMMLGLPWPAVVLHLLTVAVLASGLSGLSVGLGACMPNFKEPDASRIAAGFGGTLNLVVGLGFLLATVGLISLPWHVQAALRGEVAREAAVTDVWLAVPALLGVVLGVAAAWLPLKMGARALNQMEF